MGKKAAAEEDAQTRITQATNYAGGTLGGISSGANILFHVAVKAVATIGQAQPTVTYDGEDTVLEAKGRHDPCVLPRTPPLVEGMTALVLIDAALMQRTRLGGGTTARCDGSEPGVVHAAILAKRAATESDAVVSESADKKVRLH